MRNDRRRVRITAALGLMATLMVGAGVPAQENAPPLHTFFAPVEVPLVSIDVYVADPSGRPIPGLGVEDFEVFEDGEPVEISHFYAAPGVEPTAAERETSSEEPADEAVETPAQDLYLVVYIDDTNINRSRRQPALDHVRQFLGAELPEGLKVMIVRYDGRVQVEHAFSDNLEEIRAALDRAAASASLSRRLDEDRMLREMENALQAASMSGNRAGDVLQTSGDSLMQEIDSYVEQTVQRTRAALDDQMRFIRSLSGLGGRKAILVVSDGVEARVGERLYRAWAAAFGAAPGFEIEGQRAFLKAARNDLSNEFDELARTANAHRVSLYTLSRAGEGVAAASSAENRFMDQQGLTTAQTMSADVLMANMAGTTGGRVLTNSPGLADQLDEVAEELASYYSLAFEPTHAGDGKYHSIEVKVRRDRVRVRHRDGYLDVPPSDRLENRTLAAAVHGIGANPLGISVAHGDTVTRDDGTLLVPIIISVPIGELVLVPTEEEHQGRITIQLAVRDATGALSPVQERQYPIPVRNLDLPTALGRSAGFTLRLAMRPGPQRIAVGVRDDVGRSESVATLEVDVEPTAS